MAAMLSVEDTTVIVNGRTLEGGFSDDADCIMWDSRTLTNVKTGADGGEIHMRTGDRGGSLTLKLLADSADDDYLANLRNTYVEGGVVTLDCEIVHHRAGHREFGEMGSFMEDSPGKTLGKGDVANRMYKMRFKTVRDDRSGSLLGTPQTATPT